MTEGKYFVVSMNEDGEWGFSKFDDIAQVVECYDIDGDPEDYNTGEHPAEKFKESIDDYNPGQVLIKGHVLLPKVKKVVKKWEFE